MNSFSSPPFEEILRRVRAEYDDANLRLTPSQAQRLFGLEPPACAAVLDALLMESFLSRSHDGHFVRSPIVV
jgi:hypothetical protein